MPTETSRRRARAEIARLARADLDNDEFRWEAARVLRQAIGFDWWCWTMLDPAAGLPTRYLSTNPIVSTAQRRFYRMLPRSGHAFPEWKSGRPVSILSAVTGGDLHRSSLWSKLLGPGGAGDDMQVRLVADGSAWAHLDLAREGSARRFTQQDADFMAGLAPLLAARLRAGLRRPPRAGPRAPPGPAGEPGEEPGTIILDGELSLVGATEA